MLQIKNEGFWSLKPPPEQSPKLVLRHFLGLQFLKIEFYDTKFELSQLLELRLLLVDDIKRSVGVCQVVILKCGILFSRVHLRWTQRNEWKWRENCANFLPPFLFLQSVLMVFGSDIRFNFDSV